MSQNKANISFKGDIRLVQTSHLGTNVFFFHVSTSCPEIVIQSVAAKQFFGFSQLLGSMRKNSVFFTIAFCYTMCTEIGTEFERLYMPGIFPTGTVDITTFPVFTRLNIQPNTNSETYLMCKRICLTQIFCRIPCIRLPQYAPAPGQAYWKTIGSQKDCFRTHMYLGLFPPVPRQTPLIS